MQPMNAFLRTEKQNVLWTFWAGGPPNDFAQELDDYINWYTRKRIKLSFGGLSPMEYRQHLGLTA